eukprot:gene16417-22628_t
MALCVINNHVSSSTQASSSRSETCSPPGAPPPSLAGPIGGPPKPGPPPPGLPRAVRQSGTPPRGPTHTTPPPGALDPLRKPPVPGKPITPPPVPGNPPVTPTKALPPLAPGAVTNSPLPPTSNPATLPTPTAPANKGGLPPMAWTNGGAAPPPRTIPPAKPNPSPAPKPAPLPAPAPKPPVPAPVPAPVPKPLPKAPAPETTPPPSVSSPAPIKNQASGIKPWNPISESGGHWDMRPADAAEEQDELESVSSLGDHHGFSMETSSTMSYPKNPPADANRLAHAAAAGDNEMVTHLLASGNTALHYAAARGNVQTLELLLNQPGTDIAQCIDCTTVDQATPLHYAVYHGQTEIVQYLLQKGADPSKTNELGENGLHLASIQLNIELVTMMLANPNINPSSAAMNGRQALHYAAIRGNVPIVEALLARNCDPTIIDACGATAINLAYDAKNMEVLKLMMDHTPPEDASDVRDHKGATAYTRAVYAYTTSPVQVAILELFCRNDCVLPNLFVGTLTRESVFKALASGIDADEIVAYLRSHAHPQVAKRNPVVPEVVMDQIRLWEAETLRLRCDACILYDGFETPDLYEGAVEYARSIGVLALWFAKPLPFLLAAKEEG